ncbi:CPBP family intramembrane glutamic endopeptidase [Nocardiopsis sp. LOL_012]|uniref:CPBP family intramembrane glutamic endopeptidase n=1 Tax=Nocardiopsis sp. LOL_012 TaxID=3345409 RepID=UPI003A8B90BF
MDGTPVSGPSSPVSRRPPLPVRITVVTAAALLLWWLMLRVSGMLPGPLGRAVTAAALCVLAVALVWAARRFLDRRPWHGPVLTGPRAGWRPFLVGAASWALPGCAGMALCVVLGWSFVVRTASWDELVPGLVFLALVVLLAEALPEELIFRGYLFRNLNAALPAWAAVAAQAALFVLFGTALWVSTEGWGVLAERLPLFLGLGVVLGCIRVVTGNVWACVGFHLAFQTVAQGVLGGDYVQVRGVGTLTSVGLAAPFLLGVSTAMLLAGNPGRWRARVPDGPRA